MRIASISEPLERPSLEELKERVESSRQDIMTINGGLIFENMSYYDFWAKKKREKENDR